jgi:hypothetical protein
MHFRHDHEMEGRKDVLQLLSLPLIEFDENSSESNATAEGDIWPLHADADLMAVSEIFFRWKNWHL